MPAGQINVFTIRDRATFTSESGLFVFDDLREAFRSDATYGREFTDPNCAIGRVREDARGAVWFFARMADRMMLGAAQPQAQDSFRWFDTPFRRITDIGEVKAIYPEENGVVWFGGTEAIVRYEPSLDKPADVDFKTLIRRVSVKDSVIFAGKTPPKGKKQSGGVREALLDYAHNNAMRFEFSAAFYDETPANRYRYLLEGFDEAWSSWSAETKKDYTNLPEGRYRFRVQARNVYGRTGREAIFAFSISPPWYRAWWAYLFYALIFVTVVLGLSRTQIRRQQRKAEEALRREKEQANLREATLRADAAELRAKAAEAEKEREKEQIRTRIASDLHDEIGSNLSSIAMITQMLEKKTEIHQKDHGTLLQLNVRIP
ncbi:MAG: triple tyrosine motif-containing protein [bacterium]